MLKTSINPDLYHGYKKKKDFFEGWYFKLVHPSKKLTYCFIPGIIMTSTIEDSHSFIQFLDSSNSRFEYLRFGKEAFTARPSEFDISVGKNRFSLNNIKLDIDKPNLMLNGNLLLNNIVKWPDSIINPGSMGFYNYLYFMQCYSHVCCLSSDISGVLKFNNQLLDFTGGKAYIEKNWGKAFPYSYIWIQCNSFNEDSASLSCSIGHIPFPLRSFTGFLIGLQAEGRFYKFTSINRSKLKINISKGETFIKAVNSSYSLTIRASTENGRFMDLFAPRDNKMIPIARETLQGSVKVELIDNHSGCILFKDAGSPAGVEFSGDYEGLADKIEKD